MQEILHGKKPGCPGLWPGRLTGGSIVNNIASIAGGGIYATGSTLNLTGTGVGGTSANEANQLAGIIAVGAGLRLANGTQATLSDTVDTTVITATSSAVPGLAANLNDVTTVGFARRGV